jgi:glycine cleavage system aminomethyltransferase T
VTGGYTQLNLQGPRSRELVQRLTDTDMSNEAFPFRTCKEVAMGLARVTVARITYVGELGYELHIPTEFATHVYDLVVQEGKNLGLVHAGLKALGSLRMEKAYRDFGHDMDNLDTLLEVGLGFTADMAKPGGFIGKEAVQRQQAEMKAHKGLPRRLVQVLCLDPAPMMFHAEVVRRDGVVVGDVRVGSYGHTLGGAVGLCMVSVPAGGPHAVVNKDFLESGTWEVEIAGKLYPVKASLNPMYDPKNLKIKA